MGVSEYVRALLNARQIGRNCNYVALSDLRIEFSPDLIVGIDGRLIDDVIVLLTDSGQPNNANKDVVVMW